MDIALAPGELLWFRANDMYNVGPADDGVVLFMRDGQRGVAGQSPRVIKNRISMLATVHIVFDRQYFETMYDDWLRHRSVWGRYVTYASFALLSFGIFLAAFFPKQWLVEAIFASPGLYETIDATTDRRHWVNERLRLARPKKTVDGRSMT